RIARGRPAAGLRRIGERVLGALLLGVGVLLRRRIGRRRRLLGHGGLAVGRRRRVAQRGDRGLGLRGDDDRRRGRRGGGRRVAGRHRRGRRLAVMADLVGLDRADRDDRGGGDGGGGLRGDDAHARRHGAAGARAGRARTRGGGRPAAGA